MSAPAVERMLSTELWVSLGSLVRSYTAAASLNTDAAPDVIVDEDSITATLGAAKLEIRRDLSAWTGHWSLRGGPEEKSGHCELLPDGRIIIQGSALDLDHAAIDLVGQEPRRPEGQGNRQPFQFGALSQRQQAEPEIAEGPGSQ